MKKAVEKKLIYTQFFTWYLIDQPRAILRAWKNFLKFNLEYFSIVLLLKTLFSPWRRYIWSYGRGFDFKTYLEAFTSNVISRGLGALLRVFLILIGVALELFLFFAGMTVLALWFLWPIILIIILVLGFKAFF